MFSTKQRFGLGQVYLDATAEARRRGDRRVGTEHVLLALLVDPESDVARALRVPLAEARAALEALDGVALASVGIDTTFHGPVLPGRAGERLRLTPAARAAFTSLREEANGERLGVRHVLLVLLSRQHPDPAADLLDALGVDRAQVRDRLSGAQ
ncbi:Clp protease N-terminal domain-containing protein [Pengzhenrongella sp.]|jgi:ATP-dependent Clp protease ATP-binding subunit ClpA|uniref:Clp protease N-terminal domain-containing protein n=1 Tax=Pengzhenrongella sp. TaxID=2888820 RepID=UPI002F91EAE2